MTSIRVIRAPFDHLLVTLFIPGKNHSLRLGTQRLRYKYKDTLKGIPGMLTAITGYLLSVLLNTVKVVICINIMYCQNMGATG